MRPFQVITLIILISTLSAVDAAKSYNPASINCYIKHLKSANKLDEDIELLQVSSEIEDCEEYIKGMRRDLIKETIKSVKDEVDITNKHQCVGVNLRNSEFADLTFRIVIYEVLEESYGKNYESEKTKLSEKLASEINDAVVVCVLKDEFNSLFDELLADSESEEDDDDADYCGRKLVIDNQLIDPAVYTLQLNPKNIDTTNINCDEKLEEVIKEVEKELEKDLREGNTSITDKEMECRLKTFRDENYYRKIIPVSYFSELNLTEAQKAEEKEKFVTYMGKLAAKSNQCEEDD